MSPLVLTLVLMAAVLHASWNALIKTGDDPLVRLALIASFSALFSLPVALVSGIPAPASWPYLIASVVIHQFYNGFLILGYRAGDLSLVYPIARGTAPLWVAIGGYVVADEALSPSGAAAVALICCGIVSLAADGRRLRFSPALLFAVLTGLCIAAYTLCDGLGGRLSQSVPAYIAWLLILEAPPLALFALFRRRHNLIVALKTSWRAGLVGGLCSGLAYGMVIWAMSLSAMTYVSALRETSVILAAWFGSRFLNEPFGRRRLVTAAVVVTGIVLLQVSRAG